MCRSLVRLPSHILSWRRFSRQKLTQARGCGADMLDQPQEIVTASVCIWPHFLWNDKHDQDAMTVAGEEIVDEVADDEERPPAPPVYDPAPQHLR